MNALSKVALITCCDSSSHHHNRHYNFASMCMVSFYIFACCLWCDGMSAPIRNDVACGELSFWACCRNDKCEVMCSSDTLRKPANICFCIVFATALCALCMYAACFLDKTFDVLWRYSSASQAAPAAAGSGPGPVVGPSAGAIRH